MRGISAGGFAGATAGLKAVREIFAPDFAPSGDIDMGRKLARPKIVERPNDVPFRRGCVRLSPSSWEVGQALTAVSLFLAAHRRVRPALQDLHLHGQDRPERGSSYPAVHDPCPHGRTRSVLDFALRQITVSAFGGGINWCRSSFLSCFAVRIRIMSAVGRDSHG